ncbi:MAG: fumarylacetoacetate hydrolase family protein [Verrucomicrobiae bacterium]
MKLIRFLTAASPDVCFGVVIQNQAVPFAVLQKKAGKATPHLADSRSYLANLPDSERVAKELLAWGDLHLGEFGTGECHPLEMVRLLEPVEVAALFDFGLTPRHLKNSAEVLMKYEKDNPQTAPLLQAFAKAVMAPKPKAAPGRPEALSYYKCNMNSIVGDGETVPWPPYTSRLDVEPELAVVYGNEKQPVAGFCIFNDVSARDVQPTEFVGGFCLTKDMSKGNQLGPYLVTSDEVGDPSCDARHSRSSLDDGGGRP